MVKSIAATTKFYESLSPEELDELSMFVLLYRRSFLTFIFKNGASPGSRNLKKGQEDITGFQTLYFEEPTSTGKYLYLVI